MAPRIVALALVTGLVALSAPPARANAPLAIVGGTATGVGVVGSIIGGILWGIDAHEEYCDTNSDYNLMVTETKTYACTQCYRTGGGYYYYYGYSYYGSYTNCYATTCSSNTNYCSNSAGDLQDPLVRHAAGYDAAKYTTIGFLSLTGVGIVMLVTGLAI